MPSEQVIDGTEEADEFAKRCSEETSEPFNIKKYSSMFYKSLGSEKAQ